jgi:hypothetical protein
MKCYCRLSGLRLVDGQPLVASVTRPGPRCYRGRDMMTKSCPVPDKLQGIYRSHVLRRLVYYW